MWRVLRADAAAASPPLRHCQPRGPHCHANARALGVPTRLRAPEVPGWEKASLPCIPLVTGSRAVVLLLLCSPQVLIAEICAPPSGLSSIMPWGSGTWCNLGWGCYTGLYHWTRLVCLALWSLRRTTTQECPPQHWTTWTSLTPRRLWPGPGGCRSFPMTWTKTSPKARCAERGHL